jgi:serine/threonine protein kinase
MALRRGFCPSIKVPEYPADSYNVDDEGRFNNGNISIDSTGVRVNGDEVTNSEFTLKEIEILDVLGEGASSVVHRARHRPSGTMMALKRINIFDKDKRHQLIKELEALYDAKCPFLISFYGAFYAEGSTSIAIELMDAGSLHDVLQLAGTFPEDVLAFYAAQILEGLDYLRGRHQIHRDIKPANLCLNTKGEAKLTDFGISSLLYNTMGACDTFVGTSAYMSPERLMGKKYSYPSDIWSIGLCFLECVLGNFPYPETSLYLEFMQAVVNGEPPEAPASASDDFQAFIAACLQKDPAKRATAAELLQHPFITRSTIRQRDAMTWIGDVLESARR